MMHLYYQGKFYKSISDQDANRINMALVSPKRPYHIDIDGEVLKTSQLEVRANTDAIPRKVAYDFHNDVHRQAIRKFAAELRLWFAQQPKEWKAIEYYFEEKGAIRLEGEPRIGACSGLHIFGPSQLIVRNPDLYAQLQDKWSAYQSFIRMVSNVRAEDEPAAKALAAEAEAMFQAP
jgi:hypothetical protein